MQEFDCEIQYIKGKQNIVADDLSRKRTEVHKSSSNMIRNLMSLTKFKLREKTISALEEEYTKDPYFGKINNIPKEPFHRDGKDYYATVDSVIRKGLYGNTYSMKIMIRCMEATEDTEKHIR